MECVYNTGTNEGPRVAPTQSTPSHSGSGSGGHGASNPPPSRVLWTTLGLMGPGALVLIPPYISPLVVPALDLGAFLPQNFYASFPYSFSDIY